MPQLVDHVLAPMVRRLETREGLTPADCDALLALPFTLRKHGSGKHISWAGDDARHSFLVLSGIVCRQSVGQGRRQILSIYMKGDIIELEAVVLGTSDHSLQALADSELAAIPAESLRTAACSYPTVAWAMWQETMVEQSIAREWVVNVGRRDARTGLAHLLCELALRLERAELGNRTTFELPMYQEQLADALALTPVHTNRTLMKLEESNLIWRDKRAISIVDWHTLVEAADFDADYLHIGTPAAGS